MSQTQQLLADLEWQFFAGADECIGDVPGLATWGSGVKAPAPGHVPGPGFKEQVSAINHPAPEASLSSLSRTPSEVPTLAANAPTAAHYHRPA